MLARPMLGDGKAGGHPYLVEPLDVVDEFLEPLIAAGLADQPAMEAHRHHLGRTGRALGIEAVEAVLEELEIFLAIGKARGGDEAHVVGAQRIGDDELRLAAIKAPIGQVVVISVRDIGEAAMLGDQVHRVERAAPGIPAAGRFSGGDGVQPHRLGDLAALLVGSHVLVLDPFIAVAGDFPAGGLHGGELGRGAHQRGGDAIDGDGQIGFGEQPMQPPEAGARAVFIHGFDVPVALPRPGRGAHHIGQERLRAGIAVQDAVFAPFLIVEDELHGHMGASGPVGLGRIGAVAMHVAGVAHRCRLAWC